jgi:hypothetical protein
MKKQPRTEIITFAFKAMPMEEWMKLNKVPGYTYKRVLKQTRSAMLAAFHLPSEKKES